MRHRIVLAWSGGLEASAVIPWLQDRYAGDVVTLTLDLGQGRELEELRDRALAAGALRAHVLDVRDEFARDFVLSALRAAAMGEGQNPLAGALGDAVVASKLVEIARIERAAAVAHGGLDASAWRIARGVAALDPELRVLAPAQDGKASGRDLPARPYRIAGNLWGRSIVAQATDNSEPLPEEVFATTRRGGQGQEDPAHVEISFAHGVPVAINRVSMSLTELIESLSIIAGQHGVGRLDAGGGTPGAARRVDEAPAAIVLHAAQRALEQAVLPEDLTRLARELSGRYTQLVENGLWFTPAREALDAFFASMQTKVSGMVRVTLFNREHSIAGRTPAARATAGAGGRS